MQSWNVNFLHETWGGEQNLIGQDFSHSGRFLSVIELLPLLNLSALVHPRVDIIIRIGSLRGSSVLLGACFVAFLPHSAVPVVSKPQSVARHNVFLLIMKIHWKARTYRVWQKTSTIILTQFPAHDLNSNRKTIRISWKRLQLIHVQIKTAVRNKHSWRSIFEIAWTKQLCFLRIIILKWRASLRR